MQKIPIHVHVLVHVEPLKSEGTCKQVSSSLSKSEILDFHDAREENL